MEPFGYIESVTNVIASRPLLAAGVAAIAGLLSNTA